MAAVRCAPEPSVWRKIFKAKNSYAGRRWAGECSVRQARIPQRMLQPDSLLQERLHLGPDPCGARFRVHAERRLNDAAGESRRSARTAPSSRSAVSSSSSFSRIGRQAPPVAFGKRQLHRRRPLPARRPAARRSATRSPTLVQPLAARWRSVPAAPDRILLPRLRAPKDAPVRLHLVRRRERANQHSLRIRDLRLGWRLHRGRRAAGGNMLQFLPQHGRVDAQLLRDLVRPARRARCGWARAECAAAGG